MGAGGARRPPWQKVPPPAPPLFAFQRHSRRPGVLRARFGPCLRGRLLEGDGASEHAQNAPSLFGFKISGALAGFKSQAGAPFSSMNNSGTIPRVPTPKQVSWNSTGLSSRYRCVGLQFASFQTKSARAPPPLLFKELWLFCWISLRVHRFFHNNDGQPENSDVEQNRFKMEMGRAMLDCTHFGGREDNKGSRV